jgi:type IV fimbrial biogenesis protein FimT
MHTGMAVRQRGVTLIELMFAIAVLAILLGIGAPSFVDMVRANRTTTLTNELVVAMATARSEAVKRGGPVTVCASTGDGACGGTDYGRGTLIFTDETGVAGQLDGTDQLIQVVDGAPADYVAAGSTAFIRFFPNGRTEPAGDKVLDIERTGCSGDRARVLTVTAVGRVTTGVGAC